jgi:N-acetylglutamate synthase-like GNAT family acetyltransferase
VLTETTSQNVLEDAQRDGHLWVVLADDVPVGFAHVEIIERGAAHLAEIDVHPEHGRRGLGTRLVMHVCGWAADAGYESVTLTTFRDVPWNMPFYAKLGFRVVPVEQLSPALRAVLQDEARRGLTPSRRVVMKRPSALPPNSIHNRTAESAAQSGPRTGGSFEGRDRRHEGGG